MRKVLAIVALVGVSGVSAWAQSVLSAKSGTIHHVDGKAYISGVNLKPLRVGDFPQLEENQTLVTEDAHAEVLLTPGVFLRIGEHSSVELLSNKLSDTQLRIVSGSALVEAGEILKDNKITILNGQYRVGIMKIGLYRFDAQPETVRVFEGRAEVTRVRDVADAAPVVLKKGRELQSGDLTVTKFNSKASDELFAWSQRRSALVASANASAARTASQQGKLYKSSAGSWVFLPTFGLYTYLPGNGVYRSPFGYQYWSPVQYVIMTAPRVNASASGFGNASSSSWGGMGGGSARGGGGGNASSGGGSYSSVAATSAPTMSAPAAMGGGTARGGR